MLLLIGFYLHPECKVYIFSLPILFDGLLIYYLIYYRGTKNTDLIIIEQFASLELPSTKSIFLQYMNVCDKNHLEVLQYQLSSSISLRKG
jgi:hypothetical protein